MSQEADAAPDPKLTRIAGLRPPGRVAGALRVPGSKSIAQRALALASACGEPVRIAGLPHGEDVEAARKLASAVGARVEDLAPSAVRITGRPPGPARGWHAGGPLELGESGTLARIAIAGCALCGVWGERFELRASGSLRRRASPALTRTLRESGVAFESESWPIVLRAQSPPSSLRIESPTSSQEVSALLVALSSWPGEHVLDVVGSTPSRPYVELTHAVLQRFGVRVDRESLADGERYLVRGPLRAPPEPISIEADASLAAVALAAGCLGGGEVVASGVGARSIQGDRRIVEHLRAFGCRALAREGELVASGFPQRGARIDLSGEPDLAPVLAAVAAGAALVAPPGERESRLVGLGTLPGKESSRIDVLARGLDRAGWAVHAGSDWLAVGEPAPISGTVRLDAAGDHRMAFAFALIGLLRPGIDVDGVGAVAKSWPSFWRDLEGLGARVESSG